MTSGLLFVGLGSALGGMLRVWLTGLIAAKAGVLFPWGTLTVNVVGSFSIGLLAVLIAPGGRFMTGETGRDFLLLGVLGGFTTFSSFSLNTLHLMQEGEWLYAGLNAVGSVVACLLAVWAGYSLGNAVN